MRTSTTDDGPSLFDGFDLDAPAEPWRPLEVVAAALALPPQAIVAPSRPDQPAGPPQFGHAGSIKSPPRECRCGVGKCPAQWVGARRHPTRGWLWMCDEHQVADWPDIDAEFARAEADG